MNSQLFYFINLGIGVILLFWFLWGRNSGASQPTKLDLRRGNAEQEPPPKKLTQVELTKPPEAKQLNVRFMYNGHDWDAFEVLGIPAGARIHLVTEHYQKLIQTVDKDQIPFLEAAYMAILKKS